MKEVEITLRVKDSLEECKLKLEKQNYKIIRRSIIDDVYMTQKLAELNKQNIDEILKSSVLIRYLNADGKEFKKLTYKNKVYEGSEIVSEKKINLDCNDLGKARELLEALEFEELVRVKYNVIVLSNGIKEFAFQEVENLGLLVEYESVKDMDEFNNEEILKEKKNMIEEIKQTGIEVEEALDIKKAYQLIEKKIVEK